jgi:hypothetical protein
MRQYASGEELRAQADRHGLPTAFVWHGRPHRVVTVEEVREPRLDWWAPTGEVHRTYYVVTTDRGLICEIFRDETTATWHLSRLYD